MIELNNIPFANLIGIELANNPEYLLQLPCDLKYNNHLNSVHASALFALAENSVGYYIITKVNINAIPILRKAEVKYTRLAIGLVQSKVLLINSTIEILKQQLIENKKVITSFNAEIFDCSNNKVFSSTFHWLVTL